MHYLVPKTVEGAELVGKVSGNELHLIALCCEQPEKETASFRGLGGGVGGAMEEVEIDLLENEV